VWSMLKWSYIFFLLFHLVLLWIGVLNFGMLPWAVSCYNWSSIINFVSNSLQQLPKQCMICHWEPKIIIFNMHTNEVFCLGVYWILWLKCWWWFTLQFVFHHKTHPKIRGLSKNKSFSKIYCCFLVYSMILCPQ